MTAVTRFFDWLDEAAGGMIRLAYLLAGITAVAVYFGAGHLPSLIEGALNATLPWSLAFAIETHTYITARRVRLAWQDRQASTHEAPEWARATDAMKVNLGILAVLLAFSAWNQLNYLYETWTPPATALALPGWSAYVVRALVIPCAFMAAAFLAPSSAPVAAQVDAEARATLADVFSIARKQRRKLIRQAEKDGRDMTGALVELVEDPAARRIIAHAYGTIRAPESAPVRTPVLERPEKPNKPPTGPGSPSQVEAAPATASEASEGVEVRRLRPVTKPRQAAASRGTNTGSRKGVRTRQSPDEAERRARKAWTPGMSVSELQRAAGISRTAASKHRRILLAEEAAQQGAQKAQ
ncbi:MAG TPA: hypothetical protein VGF38_09985 [Ktedonobacterales bacterium]|jgi:hypothetical protein